MVATADLTARFGFWQERGACRNSDPNLFFHPDGERGLARVTRVFNAKQVCQTCEVMDTCRAYSLAAKEPFGIWGGMSEDERQLHLNSGT
ncbi:WhiB family transcriptional regulator [Nocardia sp. NPDC050793]|uniref:WhiB family transcriptional regulator n=1 Tax=Nocardia sp. NPDC050793 TaxID=3155159 RepID=UPI0033D79716